MTTEPEVTKILDSAVSMTRERNVDEVRSSLIKTSFELFPVRAMHFYTVPVGNEMLTETDVITRHADSDELEHQANITRGIVADGALQRCWHERQSAQDTLDDGLARLCVPVIANDSVVGLIAIHAPQPCEYECTALSALVRLYSNFVGLIREKELDTLTGVLNRRAFDHQIARLIDLAGTALESCSETGKDRYWWLVLIDIDHFKRVNDNFGHLIGDEVLILATRLMSTNFRVMDSVYRYGGEEFAALLAPSTRDEARSAVERLRQTVEQHRFPQVGQITISCGLTPIDRYDHSASVIGRADQALYHAKHSGRNQVFEYRELVEAGIVKDQSTAAESDIELF